MCIESDVRSTKISMYNPETNTHGNGYDVSGKFAIFVDDTKLNTAITTKRVRVTQEEPPTNIYAVVYDKVKEGLTNFVDML